VSSRTQLFAHAIVVLVALGLRLVALGQMPMHYDESIHAFYAWRLALDNGGYAYQPWFHGPVQIYLMALAFAGVGATETAARLAPALIGTALVALPYFLRDRIGTVGALAASVLFCISPSFVYYSRFAREDIYLAFVTLSLVIAAFAWMRRPTVARIVLVFGLLALGVATKESFLFTVLLGALFLLAALGRERWTLRNHSGEPTPLTEALGQVPARGWLWAVLAFVGVYAALFTTFGTNLPGIAGLADGVQYWLDQQPLAAHEKSPLYYVWLAVLYEWPIVVFGIVGMVAAYRRRADGLFYPFLLWWLVGTVLAYAWASEKVPWLVLHQLVPLVILAGLGLEAAWRSRRTWLRRGSMAVAAVGLAYLTASSVRLVIAPADPRELLAYNQTSPEVLPVAERVLELADAARAQGKTLRVQIDDTGGGRGPWLWYLRDLHPEIVSMGGHYATLDADVVIVTDYNRDVVKDELAGHDGESFRWRSWWIPAGSGSDPDYLAGLRPEWVRWMVDRTTFSSTGSDLEWIYLRRGL
jgi:uncharacterized protein (TIGR03663 family)